MEIDPYETCPYDKVHRIRRSRMQFHITICAKNFPASKMMQCPFDARHKINQVEFEYHKNHCPARESVLHYAIHDPAVQAETKILPIDATPAGVSEEDWDEGANVKTYNPLQAIRDKPIVYPIIGLSKAKRKMHRLQERERFNQIMENSGNQVTNQTVSQANSSLKFNPQEKKKAVVVENSADEEAYKPLRRPFMKEKQTTATLQDENKANLSDIKKLPPKVDENPNASFGSAVPLSRNKEKSTLRKPKSNNSTLDDSVFDKLSKTIEEINITDEDYKKKMEQLDQDINMLKKGPSVKKTKAT